MAAFQVLLYLINLISMSEIGVKAIKKLLPSENQLLSFSIPSYQRGYRWNTDEVNYLLNDILEFIPKAERNPRLAYMLQPVVVWKKNVESECVYELIDGQQRLTTIFLILTKLNIVPYKLKYDTREDSERFLQTFVDQIDLNDPHPFDLEVERNRNVDYWHICNASKTITDWIDNHSAEINRFKNCLLENVKVIWYDVASEDLVGSNNMQYSRESTSRALFSRLNVGKIPLTNAELIKALLISAETDTNEKTKIALAWDHIEFTLQDDKIWYFIANKSEDEYYSESRIDILFDLISSKPTSLKKDERYKYFTFNHFQDKKKSVKSNWKIAEEYFRIITDWHADGKIYNLIGFIITQNVEELSVLLNKYKAKTKSDFKNYLKQEILKSIGVPLPSLVSREKIEEILKDLKYNQNNNKLIERILLLFNVATTIQNQIALEKKNGEATLQTTYFPFDLFSKGNSWDIEHVHSQTDKEIIMIEERQQWLNDAWNDGDESDQKIICEIFDINYEEIQDDIKKGIEPKIRLDKAIEKINSPELFKKKKQDLSSRCEEQFKDKDSLFNLALLDCGTNRSYQNAFFNTKRRIIIEKALSGQFIPVCTANVFQKNYTRKNIRITVWNENDAKAYKEAMTTTLFHLFSQL